jgi:hypothetical protein
MKLVKLLLSILFVVITINSMAQVGIGTTTPDADAVLDIQATDQGVLVPRISDHTTVDPNNGSDFGMFVYDTTTKSFWYWDGAAWNEVGLSGKAWELEGNSGTTPGTGAGQNYLGTTDSQNLLIATNGSERMRILSDGKVSVNDTAPLATDRFTVTGANDEWVINGYASGSGVGVYGNGNTGVFGSGAVGVQGYADGATNYGMYAQNDDTQGTALFAIGNGASGTYLTNGSGIASTGTGVGIFGYGTDSDGTGIIGAGNNGVINTITGGSGGAFTGTRYGAVAYVSEDNNYATALYGRYTASTNTDATGVLGYSVPASYYGYGVVGYGGYIGVYGDGGNYFGLYSNGDTYVDGDIDVTGDQTVAGTKSFLIDHPTDPENKYLKHFSIESNEVLNIYRGNVILNNNGEARVSLPNYFNSINRNFSYNLTPVGQPAPGLYIKNEINDNGMFVIAGGVANQKISWYVYAERNDLYLQQNPEKRNVEIVKEQNEKGKYIKPELYNYSKDKQINSDKILKLDKTLKGKDIIEKEIISTKKEKIPKRKK